MGNDVAGYGMHSERYMGNGILPAIAKKTGLVVVKNRDICFYRTRALDTVLINDCSDVKGGATRGILELNQTRLVEDLVNHDCHKFNLDDIGRFQGLRCGKEEEGVISGVSRPKPKSN